MQPCWSLRASVLTLEYDVAQSIAVCPGVDWLWGWLRRCCRRQQRLVLSCPARLEHSGKLNWAIDTSLTASVKGPSLPLSLRYVFPIPCPKGGEGGRDSQQLCSSAWMSCMYLKVTFDKGRFGEAALLTLLLHA